MPATAGGRGPAASRQRQVCAYLWLQMRIRGAGAQSLPSGSGKQSRRVSPCRPAALQHLDRGPAVLGTGLSGAFAGRRRGG